MRLESEESLLFFASLPNLETRAEINICGTSLSLQSSFVHLSFLKLGILSTAVDRHSLLLPFDSYPLAQTPPVIQSFAFFRPPFRANVVSTP